MTIVPQNLHQTPHDPKTMRAGGDAGWRVTGPLDPRVEIARDGVIRLAEAAASSGEVFDPKIGLGGASLPLGVVFDACYGLIALQRSARRLRVFDACACAFRTVPCGDDNPADRRTLIAPVDLAIGGGRLFICDLGGQVPGSDPHMPRPPRPGRVIALGAPSLALIGVLAPPRHADLAQPWRPVSCEVRKGGGLYVADPANGAVHIFNGHMRWMRALTGFGAVTSVHVDTNGRLLTTADGLDAVRVSNPDGLEIETLSSRRALADVLAPPPFTVTHGGALDLTSLCREAGFETDAAWFDAEGASIAAPDVDPPSHETLGEVILGPFDSHIADCQFDALRPRARIPKACAMRLATLTLDTPRSDAAILEAPARDWGVLSPLHAASGADLTTLIRSDPARYLWVRLTLEGDGMTTPEVELLDIDFPRISFARYLPGVYRAEPRSADFTDRLLAIFDRGFRGVEREIDTQARLYGPRSAPAKSGVVGRPDFLSWIAAWIGLEFGAAMTAPERRRLLAAYGRSLGRTGTLSGLRNILYALLGLDGDNCRPRATDCGPICKEPAAPDSRPPLILEHFCLRDWLELGASTLGDRARLWGERLVNRSILNVTAETDRTQLKGCTDPSLDPWALHAHRMTVFLPCRLARSPARKAMAERLIAQSIPAHVEAAIEFVEPRFRVGVQASIGFDSVIGRWPAGVTLGSGALGCGMVLEGAPESGANRSGTTRLGHDSRLR